MKDKKSWIWVVMVLVIYSAGLATTAWGQEEKRQIEDVKVLLVKIGKLEKTIESQQKTIDRLKNQLADQIKENKRLLAICRKAGVKTTTPSKTSFDPGEIVYRGGKRDKKWFDMMYVKFRDKIVRFEGKYIDISPGKCRAMTPAERVWPKGTPVRINYKTTVTGVVRKGQVLISNIYGTPRIVHVHGLERVFVDGQDFLPAGTLCIYTGTFEYTNPLGGHHTVPSLAVPKPLTKEQFAEAINRGFELVEYKKIGGRIIRRPVR